MADTETTQTEQNAEGQKPEATDNPWGDDFDAAKAWRLVTNLREELKTIKGERDSLKTQKQAEESEGQSELQKLQNRLAELEKGAKEKEREIALQKVLRKHPELEDIADLLTGETEEELFQKAERLASLSKPKNDGEQEANDGGNAEEQELPGMPKPNLKPGHSGGDESASFDPVAIAKAARR
jgi:hypothetical protein